MNGGKMFSPRLVKFPPVLDSQEETCCSFRGIPHRVHYSKFRLSKIYTEIEDKCKCCLSSGCHLSHVFFICPELPNFWTGHFRAMSSVMGLCLDQSIAIFGTPIQLNSIQREIVAFTSLLRGRHLLLEWKSQNPPSVSSSLKNTFFFFSKIRENEIHIERIF